MPKETPSNNSNDQATMTFGVSYFTIPSKELEMSDVSMPTYTQIILVYPSVVSGVFWLLFNRMVYRRST